jgi:transposase
MRRTHLRGHDNILKRLLVHVGAFNLGLILRMACGVGTPRGLQNRLRAFLRAVSPLMTALVTLWATLRDYFGDDDTVASLSIANSQPLSRTLVLA